MKMNYSFNKSTEQQIKDHFWRMDTDFTPPLHTYVNIDLYAQKLAKSAIRIENYVGANLIGLIGVYYNSEKQFIFVSNFSIEKEYRGNGMLLINVLLNFMAGKQNQVEISPRLYEVGVEFLEILAEYAKPFRPIVNSIQTEVRNSNRKALLLYKRLGFEEVEIRNESTYLIKDL